MKAQNELGFELTMAVHRSAAFTPLQFSPARSLASAQDLWIANGEAA